MNDQELKLQIDNLITLIEVEEENYKVALQTQTEFVVQQRMKEHIENLQSDLQVFLDKQAVMKTGELPADSKNADKNFNRIQCFFGTRGHSNAA
jgi:hypothetical protein